MQIGFIGQGFIGKNYADDFEHRGYSVVRYSLEEEYKGNREKLQECDIVFIAVPTPTTPDGFDDSAVRDVLRNIGEGKTAVVKSTLKPGTTQALQDAFPHIYVLHSPEFLRESTAAYDAAHPERNIIGIPVEDDAYRAIAQQLLSVLPNAPFSLVCKAAEAELIKYAGNAFLYTKVVFMNAVYEYAQAQGLAYDTIAQALSADNRIGDSHMQVVHKSGPHARTEGRGAGGHCLIKDFASFVRMYSNEADDPGGAAALRALEQKNIDLLCKSEKDLDLLEGVYGSAVCEHDPRDPASN